MSLSGKQEPTMDPLQPDPLLKPGAFIDPKAQPEPVSFKPGPSVHQTPEKTSQPSDQTAGSDPHMDWLPSGWTVVERVRASGVSAGTKDKYYMEPVTKRRFRSKKEVLSHLGIEGTPMRLSRKKKNPASDDAVTTTQANNHSAQKKKRKRSEITAEELVKSFNFDDVPAKVKWELADVNKSRWKPLMNSVDKVSETTREEWGAAFTYLTLANETRGAILL